VSAEPVPMRRLGFAVAIAAALITSACAAGQDAQTAVEHPAIDGTEADVGSMNLRGLVIEPPSGTTPYYATGADAPVKLVVVNSGSSTDKLTSITSSAIGDWGAFASAADASAVASSSAAAAGSSTPAGSSTASGSSSSAAGGSSAGGSTSASASSSTPAATASALPTPQKSISIAAGSRVSWGTPDAKGVLLLLHVTKRLYPGAAVSLTFTFANAGSVTVMVPVGLSSSPGTAVVSPPSSTGAA
jgi:hypothetical protein